MSDRSALSDYPWALAVMPSHFPLQCSKHLQLHSLHSGMTLKATTLSPSQRSRHLKLPSTVRWHQRLLNNSLSFTTQQTSSTPAPPQWGDTTGWWTTFQLNMFTQRDATMILFFYDWNANHNDLVTPSRNAVYDYDSLVNDSIKR